MEKTMKRILFAALLLAGCATTSTGTSVAAPTELAIVCAGAEAGLTAAQTVTTLPASLQAKLATATPIVVMACNGAATVSSVTLANFTTTALPTLIAVLSAAPNPNKTLIGDLTAFQIIMSAATAAATAI
jgi:hypothetical protein